MLWAIPFYIHSSPSPLLARFFEGAMKVVSEGLMRPHRFDLNRFFSGVWDENRLFLFGERKNPLIFEGAIVSVL